MGRWILGDFGRAASFGRSGSSGLGRGVGLGAPCPEV